MTIDPIKGWEILNDIFEISSSDINPDKKLENIVNIIADRFNMDLCSIFTIDKDKTFLDLQSSNKMIEDRKIPIGKGIRSYSALNREPVIIEDIENVKPFLSIKPMNGELEGYKSIFSLPLYENDLSYGVLVLKGKNKKILTDIEKRVLFIIAKEISRILWDFLFKFEIEKKISELTILHKVNKALMSTIELNRLSRIILSAVTVGDVFGFNRAMLFLVDEDSNTLKGFMGVGPDSLEDAEKIWKDMNASQRDFFDIVNSLKDIEPVSLFNSTIKKLEIPIHKSKYILPRTVSEKKSFIINKIEGWIAPWGDEEIISKLFISSYATVPIISKNKVLGVLMVDNIYNNKAINEEDINFLMMFANQAGLAIENSILYNNIENAHKRLMELHEKLMEAERLAILGEISADIAHEIRGPLVSIGGFARRLYNKKIEKGKEEKYLKIIVDETTRLERVLNELLGFTKRIESRYEELDINEVIEDALSIIEEDLERSSILIIKNLDRDIKKVKGNREQIHEVFMNIFLNAQDAMKNGGVLTIKTYNGIHKGIEKVFIEISDTGGGIPDDILSNIFKPFFTTKDMGTGLGLTLSHRIITHHGGRIDINNEHGKGVTFIISLNTGDE